MPTFQKCDPSVREMANAILCQYPDYEPLLDAKVTIDFVFAFADEDDAGNKVGNALSKNGCKALGICRKLPLKDRAMGRADAEISLDGDWWNKSIEEEQRALLDHELYHIQVKLDKRGLVRDDLQRPVLKMRAHDYEFGWFNAIAARHGLFSGERMQAKEMMETAGQYYWPEFLKK